ncbi:cell death in tomato 1 [Clathrospora elynae]|uniref:Cell death in tomato 1 n=1 Tax=Clathrospora elynae TaxID=706981 RepID=A0A6A5T1Y2_9PLEO|nr:cell death in tomato 1 [Clathrospora elynae]
MRFATAALAAVMAFTSSITASPLEIRAAKLKDWQVTGVGSGSPSGRPGSYPWASITANVTDPNAYNLGTASSDGSAVIISAGSQGINCKAQWFIKNEETPLGRTWPCDPAANGYWVMRVLDGGNGFGTGVFNLTFTHVLDVLYLGEEYTASYVATGHFEVGKNMAGTCGGSGVCNWGLKPENNPFPITPKKA